MHGSMPAGGPYPCYHALWHLEAIGVLSAEGVAGAGWHAAAARAGDERETRVVLIDNSVAWEHPNLRDAIDTSRMIDFVAARLGAFPIESDPEHLCPAEGAVRAVPAAVDVAAARTLADSVGGETPRLLDALVGRLSAPPGERPALPATRAAFSAHGTAMAGLIGARPSETTPRAPPVIGALRALLEPALAPPATVLPYAGVDPFCRIVPVSASFDPDPEQYLLALLYAALVDADVIVLARDFPDPRRSTVTAREPLPPELADASARVPLSTAESALWDELAALLENLSRRVPILCAAGNGRGERILYPASLARADNGIVAVGACNALGHVAGYSPGGADVDVFAPSGDGERLDAALTRVDFTSRHAEGAGDDARLAERAASALERQHPERADRSTYALQDLIATDVPGRFGYDRGHVGASPGDAVADDPLSCYCRFGGTSGAVAVAAGFLSLMYSSGALERDAEGRVEERGRAAKEALIAAAGAAAPRTEGAAGAIPSADTDIPPASADGAPGDGSTRSDADGRPTRVLHWREVCDRR